MSAKMDADLLDEMDFSFSCDKCSFSTKDMMEIKRHMYNHRSQGREPSQPNPDSGSTDVQQSDTQKDSTVKAEPSHISTQASSDKDGGVEETTPSFRDTHTSDPPSDLPSDPPSDSPSDLLTVTDSTPTTKDKPSDNLDTPLVRDTPVSPPSQHLHDEGDRVPSLSRLQDADVVQARNNDTERDDAGLVTGLCPTQNPGRETTVIVSRGEKPLSISQVEVRVPDGSTNNQSQDKVKESQGSIADRIHSRRRPSTKKPQEPYQEEDEDYVPYKPARHVVSKVKGKSRRVKRRATHSSQIKLRPVIANDRYKCQHCHFVCKFKQSLRAHVRGSHPEVYAKMVQGDVKSEEEGLEEAESRDSSAGSVQEPVVGDEIQSQLPWDRYKCDLCPNFFCRFKKDLYDHKSRIHGVSTPVYKYQSRIPENRYHCPDCDYICKFQRTLRLHCRSVHPKVIKSPEVKEKKEKEKREMKKIPENRYRCPECDFACKFKGQMKSHRSKLHKKERPPKMVREQQCEFCNKFIQGTTHHYRRHLKTHTGDKPYKCPICDAVFGDQSRLNAHAPIHLDERNYLCDQCGKSFKRAINLRMHRKVHLVVRPHACELCNYRCKRHDTLNLHMKRKHLKIRRILCDTCGKKFFSEKECQLHAARKHLPRPTPFQCTFCPMAFPFAYNLRAHMKKHPEHKPFRCDFCSFESRSKASLQDHEKMHTGEKQKKCEMCEYTTSTSSNLYKHRKRQHGIVMNHTKSPKSRNPTPLDRHAPLSQTVMMQGSSPHGSLPTTPQPHPMMPTQEGHHAHAMHLQGRIQGSPLPGTSRIQGTPSPSLSANITTQSVAMATASGLVDLRNMQTYEEIDFKDRRAIIYGREKSLIGSVITEALAEARNVVQSELYSGHMIPSTIATAGLHPTALSTTTTMAPLHGGIVPGDAIIHTAIPTSTGAPQSVASGATNMFNTIMNLNPY